MSRLLVLILLVVAAVWLVKRVLLPKDVKQEPNATTADELVACAHCGVHLPRGEARTGAGGRLYCSDEHARLGNR